MTDNIIADDIEVGLEPDKHVKFHQGHRLGKDFD
jgi:hypothetical protein